MFMFIRMIYDFEMSNSQPKSEKVIQKKMLPASSQLHYGSGLIQTEWNKWTLMSLLFNT